MRKAVTLLELLVVLAVIWLLTALLLPAVQSVRQAADRLACRSKLRQIALASHHYEQIHGNLPPAFKRRRPKEPLPHLQWPIHLAVCLEQEATFREAVEDYGNDKRVYQAKSQHRGMNRPMSILSCPTDTRLTQSRKVTLLDRIPNRLFDLDVAAMSYLGVSGTDSRYCNGMMTADQGISLVAVSDGTSNTLFFGERPPPIGFEYGWLYAGDGQDGFGSLDSVLGVRDRNQTGVNRSAELYVVVTGYRSCGPGPFAYAPPGADRKCDAFRFWSLHVGGANFAFADGSVRFLNYGADAVLPALATRAGGEVVSLE